MAHDPLRVRDGDPASAPGRSPRCRPRPSRPGKVAMWLFLATEIMFFTGLIGSYIVLRCGSPLGVVQQPLRRPRPTSRGSEDTQGVKIDSRRREPRAGPRNLPQGRELRPLADRPPEPRALQGTDREGRGPHRRHDPARRPRRSRPTWSTPGPRPSSSPCTTYSWPLPYHTSTNPLSIDLTALNTFFLICSSVTMVLALSAVQRNDQKRFVLFLLATVLIGSLFVGIQFIEYRKLMFADAHPIGISRNGHFRPDSSLFGSCFFTMTGFHGAHVTGGVILLTCILIQAIRGKYNAGQPQLGRAGRALLALRRPRLDHPVHGRLPDLSRSVGATSRRASATSDRSDRRRKRP